MNQPTRAGFIAIIGRPNAGKSTLMNAIIGAKLSIVSPKPQTTRKRILGIYSDNNLQVIFLDTPGIIKPKYELQKNMMGYVAESIHDADIIVPIIDITKFKGPENYFPDDIQEVLRKSAKPKILLINKVDTIFKKNEILPVLDGLNKLHIFDEIIPISALKSQNTDAFINTLQKYLPESPFYYDPDLLSTQPEKFFVSELIREAVLSDYREEVPYSTEIQITEFRERTKGKWYISADIIVERKTQKIIIIGAKGDKIKSLGEKARQSIELHLGRPVYLELFVKVRDKWRNNKSMLKNLGY